MDKPISVGDLVQVVRPTPCCGRTDWIGLTFVVDWLDELESKCFCCEHEGHHEIGAGTAKDGDDGFTISVLKRIPPLSELEGKHSEDAMDIFDFLDL